MWIRRLTVANWRGLDCELSELSPGLNLIHGPNEAGKSRLVEALRFALFERSSGRSAHKKALASWGLAPGKPRVSVELELGGVTWTLDKEFLGSGHNTRLRSDRQTLEGADAEAHLAELLGVRPGGRTEQRPEDRGIWSLLWVDQGSSRDAPLPNDLSQARLHDRLTQEIGEVAAGRLGQQVLRRAQELRERFYTASRDAEKAILTEPREAVAQLRHRLSEAAARRDAVAADADALDGLRARERDLSVRVGEAEQRLGDLRGLNEQAMELGRQLDLYEEQVQSAESRREQALAALQAAEELTAEASRLAERTNEATMARYAAERARANAQQAADEAARLAADAEAQLGRAERELRELEHRRERLRRREQAEDLRSRLAAATQAEAELRRIQTELAALAPVAARDLEALRRAEQTLQAARARLEGASVSLELTALRELEFGGETLAPGTIRRVLVEDEQHLDLSGIASITVKPGGGELPKLRDAVRDAERHWLERLETLGARDLADAERIVEHRRVLEADLTRCRQDLERHLPEGREAAESRLHALEAALAADGDADVAPVSAEALEAAREAVRQASQQREARRAAREVAHEVLAAARETAAVRRAELQSLERQLAGVEQRRRTLPDPATLRAELAAAERAWAGRLAARDELEQRFDALGGDDIQLDLERAERAWEQLGLELQQVRVECARLQARLESAGDDGRHELVQELEAELLRSEAELAGLLRQAAAARRLHEVLLDEYERARERLAEPVIARIRPYLQSLFPHTEVWLDEDLNLRGLRHRDTDQPFEALSGGAREQLSLLVRIGLAEVLGADEPWPLVLDDVLVNTDAERIRLVQRLLYQAGRRMQILLFTCHGPLFDGLGADRRIELPAPNRGGRPQIAAVGAVSGRDA